MNVTCPSGLSGEIRKLKGREANNLADRRLARKGETYDYILRGCWIGTDDAGPYEHIGVHSGESNIPWGRILVCDRFYILAAIRVATYGSEYSFKCRCGEDGSGCGEKFEWTVDIARDLDVYDLPDESRIKIANNDNRFTLDFDGMTIVHKLMTGDDEKRAGRVLMKNKKELVTTSIAQRIIQIDDLKSSQKIVHFLEEMDMDVQLEILNKLEGVDGGIETEFEVECPRCENDFRAPVPFEGEAFWIPRKRSSRREKRSKRVTRTMESGS